MVSAQTRARGEALKYDQHGMARTIAAIAVCLSALSAVPTPVTASEPSMQTVGRSSLQPRTDGDDLIVFGRFSSSRFSAFDLRTGETRSVRSGCRQVGGLTAAAGHVLSLCVDGTFAHGRIADVGSGRISAVPGVFLWQAMGRDWLYRDARRRCFFNWRTATFSNRACLSDGVDGLTHHGIDLGRADLHARCRLPATIDASVLAYDGAWRIVAHDSGFGPLTAYNCHSRHVVALPSVIDPVWHIAFAHAVVTYRSSEGRDRKGAFVDVGAFDLNSGRRFSWRWRPPKLSCDPGTPESEPTIRPLIHGVLVVDATRTRGPRSFCLVKTWRARVSRLS
jgi:hypothetical protein